jgi:NAD(P)-dependent dehydrogenase (short-subunit alcohol dehydrogenase family)
MDTRRLAGKVLIVTGATRGIGLAGGERLGAEGARLVLTARGEDDAATSRRGCARRGGRRGVRGR